ncbi:hypothetical protein FXO38_35144 [Capsicum annuum]|nr:hypothetical protein FXO38_35144 [Capsicum annuum]KAF3643014.1 hypothetical protein FXO37_22229 [Capsicum annuum]
MQASSKSISCAAYLMPWHYQVLSIAFRPSHFMRGENQKAAIASHASLASSCDVVVRERRSGFSDAVDAVVMAPSSTPICPIRRSLQTTVALTLNLSAPSRAGRAHATPALMRNATWLILPVVIYLSQRLSHACVSMNKFRL